MTKQEFEKRILDYCEKYGIYEIYRQNFKLKTFTYYSLYHEGMYKIIKNIETGHEQRLKLKVKKIPEYLITPEGYTRYNYMTG
jgi:hypothetical protein